MKGVSIRHMSKIRILQNQLEPLTDFVERVRRGEIGRAAIVFEDPDDEIATVLCIPNPPDLYNLGLIYKGANALDEWLSGEDYEDN